MNPSLITRGKNWTQAHNAQFFFTSAYSSQNIQAALDVIAQICYNTNNNHIERSIPIQHQNKKGCC
ncbi:hypothetical protein TVAG_331610 [Trichomonas vaginalis G3]|uniref:Uncharacterized protein n=1 Tax=Trichomonas vaginalis (strain ATCC PRA-98 / G3) TaxID=412133 RepID=A2G312_TRIV3|nr:hypothetical protein TVAGG3_0669270 [Trichomonas vaginalis G3]EAX88445.1 hypothetical protein TVAG_331610 [Trichomonas vaginalis G3]KAI5507073.1 hypothetical protein TVAGG3_0669270 [Trichomonas vaginalis G3]|eukprot:XP_001301375.1 hypothetical protein [Trichomonas vaginalis G3]